MLISGCGTAVNFPVSTVTPAAQIKVQTRQDKNKNNVYEITANHMASPERLSPPKKCYVVWGVTSDNGIKNLGQLVNKNAERDVLNTKTPFTVKQLFITAEDQGNISQPQGVEISRLNL